MTTPPTVQTNPLDPVFSGIPVVIPQGGLVNPTWNKWFVDLREKVNVINSTLAAWSGITPVTGLTPGTYGDATHYPIVTVNEFGLVTNITNQSVPTNVGNTVTVLTISGGVVNIDCSLGDYFTLLMTSSVTSITFSNLPPSGQAKSIMLSIQQNGTGGFSLTIPASFFAINGSDTTIQTTANSYTILAATTFNQGTRWEYSMKAG